MNVEFRASFAKDLKNVSNKHLLKRVRETIEEIELAPSVKNISGLKKLKAAGSYYRIRVGEYRIGLILKGDTFVFVRCRPQRDLPILSVVHLTRRIGFARTVLCH